MKSGTLPFFALLLCGACGALGAQNSKTASYHTSANSFKQSAEEIEDIGELNSSQGATGGIRDKLRFNITAREAYTTNALLEGSHSSSDAVFLPTLEAGFRTALGNQFSFDLSAKVEAASYAVNDERSFAGYSAVATLDYQFKPGMPKIYASVEPYRFDSFDTGDLISQAIGFTGGIEWDIPFNAGRSLGFAGYSFSDYLADPNIDSRLVNRVVVGLAHQFRSNLTGQLYYQYRYSDYTEFDRDDHQQTVAANLIYQFARHWFGSLTTSYINNDSTQTGASYETFSTTLGITLQF